MTPKFRAWIKSLEVMADVLVINFEEETVLLKGYKRNTWANFNQVILMQSTDLKDKNAIEIFEGDFIKGRGGVLGVVRYIEEDACFMATNKAYGPTYIPKGYLKKYTEVVGNIYENPELLKENAEFEELEE